MRSFVAEQVMTFVSGWEESHPDLWNPKLAVHSRTKTSKVVLQKQT